jgi:hypothetical protein
MALSVFGWVVTFEKTVVGYGKLDVRKQLWKSGSPFG